MDQQILQEPLTLDHPDVQKAKKRWDLAKNRRTKVTFETLFEYFKTDCIRFTALVEETGISKSRVQQLYDKYFRHLFEKSGRMRQQLCSFENNLVRQEQSIARDPYLRLIYDKAHALDYVVETVPTKTGRSVRSDLLIINGWRCAVRYTRTKFKPAKRTKRFYAHNNFRRATLTEVDFLIIHSNIEGYKKPTFVIPCYVVEQKGNVLRKDVAVDLPLKRYRKHTHRKPKVDWWKYAEAWHLLKPKEPDSS